MLPLRHKNRWRIAGVVLLILVLAAAMAPAIWLTQHFPTVILLSLDTWLHMLTFLCLALWFSGQYQRSSYWRLAIGLTAFGALIELCQGMISYRLADWTDLGADVLGTGLGLAIAVAGTGGWSLRFEQWMEKEKVEAGID